MAQKALRTCFGVFVVCLLLTAGAAQAAPFSDGGPRGLFAGVFEWLRAQLGPGDEIYGGISPNGSGPEASPAAIHGIISPNGLADEEESESADPIPVPPTENPADPIYGGIMPGG